MMLSFLKLCYFSLQHRAHYAEFSAIGKRERRNLCFECLQLFRCLSVSYAFYEMATCSHINESFLSDLLLRCRDWKAAFSHRLKSCAFEFFCSGLYCFQRLSSH